MKRARSRGRTVPPRWLKCPRKSEDFIAKKFLIFKTPLDEKYDSEIPPEYRFHPSMIMDYMKMKKLKLGLWIDLTNTDRFYDRTIVENEGIRYIKMPCVGHGATPSQEQINVFNRVCEQFIDRNPDECIGVHCTHGFNRSGFLVASFIIEQWNWSLSAFLLHFSKLRPPGIYKHDYIEKLKGLFGLPDEDLQQTPPTPNWCDSDEAEDDADFSSGFNSKMRRGNEAVVQNPQFMEGITGVTPVSDTQKLRNIQRRAQGMCDWRTSGFPGSQPVSMDINNIKLLESNPYMVSWKADGTRYMMLIDGRDEIYFIDRNNSIYKVEGLTFLYRKDLDEHLSGTLVDGEMVIDKVGDTDVPRYLIYDIIRFRGEEVGKRDFRIRLHCIENELIEPRRRAISKGIIDRNSEPFGVRFKPFWFLNHTNKILDGRFAKELVHEPDGLIFQPVRDAYVPGKNDSTLKWKPPELNTIDFRLKIVQQSGQGLLPIKIGELYVGGLDTPFSTMQPVGHVAHLDGKIIECKLVNNKWTFLRERADKSFPNNFKTAQGVLYSIMHPVTKEYLLEFIRMVEYRRSSELAKLK